MNVTVIMSPGWEQKIKIEGTSSMHRLVDAAERVARINVAHHTRSGALLASIRTTKTLNGGRVWIGTDHWPHIEYGTKPHIINPKVKQALWWAGAPYPVRRVRHPGTAGYAPMRRVFHAIKWG